MDEILQWRMAERRERIRFAAVGRAREIKHLAELGYAQQERSRVGKRQRTVYAITSQGLEALRAWLATPVARFSMEC